MGNTKYYCLYSNKKQEKFLTTATTEEQLKEETEYYTDGVWFSYDAVENSSRIINEKEVKGIKFPVEAKKREPIEIRTDKKWIV